MSGINPYTNYKELTDLYDETRDDQCDETDLFANYNYNIINDNIYENYKSYFYRYQDYNQINR